MLVADGRQGGLHGGQRQEACQGAHGGAVGGEAEAVPKFLVEDLGRWFVGQAGFEACRFGGEAGVAEAPEDGADLGGGAACQVLGADLLAEPGPVRGWRGEGGEGFCKEGFQGQDRHQGAVAAAGLSPVVAEDGVEDDIVVAAVEVVAVGDPDTGAEVDLDAAGAQLAAVEEEHGVAEVGAEAVGPGAILDGRDPLTAPPAGG